MIFSHINLFKTKSNTISCIFKEVKRNLISKQLMYTQFGDPLEVVKIRECEVPPLGKQEVLVRMLAAPINPADINTIQGRQIYRPNLPTVPGDEGVGEVVEIGSKVCSIGIGNRVVLTQNLLGTWRYYGIYPEGALHRIPHKLPLAEASMLSVAPCTALRMISDFRNIEPGQTIMQNAANSPVGQCVIMLCKALGIKTMNIVANHCGYNAVKEYLTEIGGNLVCTLEEAEEMSSFSTALSRPVLAFNCLGGRYEDVMLKILECNGTLVYYGCSYDLPMAKQSLRPDASFYKFHYGKWCQTGSKIEKTKMLNKLVELIVIGKLHAPVYIPIQLKDYIHAFRNTVHCEAFATKSYIFDFTCP